MIEKKKRKVDILVLSDLHPGTYGFHAKVLLCYLESIKLGIVILNGDIIDIWQFSKRYWPKSHMKVIKHVMHWVSKGIKIYYITGNHDEMMRKFAGFKMGSFIIVNKLVLNLNNTQKAWFFDGDVFDITMQHSKWLAELGSAGYDLLILINRFASFVSEKIFKKGKLSISKSIKNGVKSAVKFINQFEQTAAKIGISNQYDFVVCGHIHQPEIKKINTDKGEIIYLNSGDWIENLTALEYQNNEWQIYKFKETDMVAVPSKENEQDLDNDFLFNNMLKEFNLIKQY